MKTSRLALIKDWERKARKAKYDVAALARLCRCSPSTLRRYFSEMYKMGPRRWMMQLRHADGRRKLTKKKLAKEVSDALGFSSYSSYSRSFKNHFGLPPVEVLRPPLAITRDFVMPCAI